MNPSHARRVALCGHEHEGDCAYCEIERLREALRVYGGHTDECLYKIEHHRLECQCGFAKVWRALDTNDECAS